MRSWRRPSRGRSEFRTSWQTAIQNAIDSIDPGHPNTVDFFQFDALFDQVSTTGAAYLAAFLRLLSSLAVNSLDDELRGARGFGDVPAIFQRTVVMVAQWVANDDLRATLRDRFAKAVADGGYDAVLAHSLGSLIAHDTLARQPNLLDGKTFVSFGSQIGRSRHPRSVRRPHPDVQA